MDREQRRRSKFLSYVLRHHPEEIGLTLDRNGWVTIDELLARSRNRLPGFDRPQLLDLVANCPKQRFTLSADGRKIRAAQGHSTAQVQLEYVPQTPPALLYHGTARHFLPSIRAEGLTPQGRHLVHLSSDVATAMKVGQRHGKPVVLTVRAAAMACPFYRADNGVWLVAAVPPQFLEFPD